MKRIMAVAATGVLIAGAAMAQNAPALASVHSIYIAVSGRDAAALVAAVEARLPRGMYVVENPRRADATLRVRSETLQRGGREYGTQAVVVPLFGGLYGAAVPLYTRGVWENSATLVGARSAVLWAFAKTYKSGTRAASEKRQVTDIAKALAKALKAAK